MNRTEGEIAEGIGLLLGFLIRTTVEVFIFVIVPLAGAAAIGYLWLHEWLTSQLIEAFELPDSFLVRMVTGAVLFPVVVAVTASVLLLTGFAFYFVITTNLDVIIKAGLVLVLVGTLLSLLAVVRSQLAGAGDAPLELDFENFWSE
jgi:hypothetical protein